MNGSIEVNSPITITVDGEQTYELELYAGESILVESVTEIHVDGVTGHIAEIKIPDFDGVGIEVEYSVDAYPGVFEIPVCVVGEDSYFYIGDPTETLDEAEFLSSTTFNTALDLDPEQDYVVESRVIMADAAICDSIPSPIFTAD